MLVPMETSENRAGIEAIKAKFILFMYHDLPVPLNVSKLAMELDPKFAYWKYLTGKIIRKLMFKCSSLKYFIFSYYLC